MAEYRLYWFLADQHIHHAKFDEFATDEAAVSAAKRRLGQYTAVEVWQRERLVGRVDAAAMKRRSELTWRRVMGRG